MSTRLQRCAPCRIVVSRILYAITIREVRVGAKVVTSLLLAVAAAVAIAVNAFAESRRRVLSLDGG